MLHVKTKLDVSSIHGIGLFAAEKIKKGEVVYTPSGLLDVNVSISEFALLDEISRWHITHYGFRDRGCKRYHLAFDNIRFCNHSKKPNIGSKALWSHNQKFKGLHDYQIIALCDIQEGVELLQDFNDFEDPIREALR